MSLSTILTSSLERVLVPRPFWSVVLSTGKHLTELDVVRDPVTQEMRPFDWALDLFGTANRVRIQELWIHTPPTQKYPTGQHEFLSIKEPGCLFQFKVGAIYALGEEGRQLVGMVIGRVDDKSTGECTCFVWDASLEELGLWHTNVYSMGAWKPGILDIGPMQHAILGIDLS